MKIITVRRGIRFRQTPLLKDFVDMCTSMRKSAKSGFEERLYKLVLNSIFGKFITNSRNFSTASIIFTPEKIKQFSSKPFFKQYKIINEDCVVIQNQLPEVTLHMPYHLGFSILEFSKLYMFQCYYDYFQPYFEPQNMTLLFSDTDSFAFGLKSKSLDNDFFNLQQIFDFSKYPKNHPLFSLEKKNALFHFKDEFAGKNVCTRFVGLRPKSYAMKVINKKSLESSDKKVAKGVGRTAIKNQLTYEKYEQCLLSRKISRENFYSIKSVNHQLSTTRIRKIALSAFDSKRYIYQCGIHSSPYGSSLISKNNFKCYICGI